MEDLPAGGLPGSRVLFSEGVGQGGMSLGTEGEADALEVNSSARKKSLRSTARGRLAKSRPKSPLLRMAEMRRGGLRRKASCLSGRIEGSGVKGMKGKKRAGERRMQGKPSLSSIPEAFEFGSLVGLPGVVEGEADMLGDSVGMAREDPGADVGGTGEGSFGEGEGIVVPATQGGLQIELIPAGDVSDLALDIISAQPLQEMEFVGQQVILDAKMGGDGLERPALELSLLKETDTLALETDLREGVVEEWTEEVEEFPHLCRENLRNAKGKETLRGSGEKEVPRAEEPYLKGQSSKNREGPLGGSNPRADSSKWQGGKSYKSSLAEGASTWGNQPVSFEPEKSRRWE